MGDPSMYIPWQSRVRGVLTDGWLIMQVPSKAPHVQIPKGYLKQATPQSVSLMATPQSVSLMPALPSYAGSYQVAPPRARPVSATPPMPGGLVYAAMATPPRNVGSHLPGSVTMGAPYAYMS